MVTSLLFDFAITSVLLFAGYLLRKRFRIFQRLFIPAPLIGGILGILLGPQVLGAVSPVCLQYSEYQPQTALPLFCCVFCSQLFMMKFDGGSAKKALHSFLLMSVAIFVQVLIGMGLVRLLMPGANDAYGMMAVTSFEGGPGYCTIVTNTVGDRANFSVETADSIGNTFAAISMLSGVIIGMVLINIARRKGVLTQTGNLNEIPEEELTGYVEPGKRVPIGEDVTNNNSLNSLALQFAIAGVVIFVGLVMHKIIVSVPALSSITINVPVIIAGLLVGILFKAFKWDRIVDMKSVNNFSSTALEYLIASTIASTNIYVFATHGALLVTTSVAVIVTNIIVLFGLGRLWNREYWFENTVGVYGLSNGVAATGLLLLRTSDPKNTSGALAPFCTAIALLVTTVQFLYFNLLPMWISDHGNAILVGTVVILAVFLAVGFATVGKRKAG